MSNEKLNRTARAAGFAMAIDETAGGPEARPAGAQSPTVQKTQTALVVSTAMTTLKAARQAAVWPSAGWSFWKTA